MTPAAGGLNPILAVRERGASQASLCRERILLRDYRRGIIFRNSSPGKEDSGLRDFLTILFKHKSKIATIFLATVGAVTIGSFLLTPTYEARSSLMVKFGGEYVNRSEAVDARSFPWSLHQEEMVNSEIQILTSRELIEKVLTALKVGTVYPDLVESPPSGMTPLQAAILAFEKKLTVEGVKKSNVIEVAFRHKNPQLAARVVNLLVDGYKEKRLQVFSDPPSSFLEKQLAYYERQLKESEDKLESFKQRYRVFSLDEQRSLLLRQRVELDTSLKNLQNQNDELQIARAATLKKQLGRLDREIRTLDLREGELQPLKRDLSTNEKHYRTYLERLEEARISENLNRRRLANISVIQAAAVPARPIQPNKAFNILLGLLLGAVSGLGFAFFSEYAAESYSTPEQTKKDLGLPILTTVSFRK
jgi:uncharacterized protein involved in exopolysaccharide biosynthesis